MPCATIPAALATTAAVAGIAGTGISVYGSMQTAAAQSASEKYAAQVAANNQITANNAAQDALARGQVAETEKAQQTAEVIGRQKAASAANGVEVNSGSAVDLQSDAAGAGELDQLTIANNAQREAVGYQNQGIGYANQAQLDEASSQNALTAGAVNSFSTALKGAGSVASQWYDYSYGTRKQTPSLGS